MLFKKLLLYLNVYSLIYLKKNFDLKYLKTINYN